LAFGVLVREVKAHLSSQRLQGTLLDRREELLPQRSQRFTEELRLVAESDGWIYVLGAGLGIAAGALDVRVGDLLVTALFVLTSTMLLALLRPERPWRWVLIVGVFVPVLQLLAYIFLTEKPYRAQIYESFLGFLTGIAGAYGGSVARKGWNELHRK
jgi:hypothetical protein